MDITKIELSELIVDKLMQLSYELDAREFLIKKMLESTSLYNKEIFDEYHHEFVRYFMEFEVAKQMISNEYIPENLREHNVTWEVDYSTRILTIYKHCECEV